MVKPKRYLVFAFEDYGANGGWDDLDSYWDTEPQAVSRGDTIVAKGYYTNAQVIDLETGEDIYKHPDIREAMKCQQTDGK